MKNFWTKYKSMMLSYILVKAMTVIDVIFAICIPFATDVYCKTLIEATSQRVYIPLTVSLYCAAIFVFVACIALDRLLCNLKKDIIFDKTNVKYLRYISWCCFATAAVFFLLTYFILLAFMISVSAVIFGLIFRVIKNLFCEAVEIKSENDLTI